MLSIVQALAITAIVFLGIAVVAIAIPLIIYFTKTLINKIKNKK